MILLNKLRTLFNPERYQGWGNTRKYFEGWYFKIVNASETRAYAFIPGIAMDEAGLSHSFVQVLDGKNKKSEYYSFSASLFKPSASDFEIYIDNNYFSTDSIEIDLPEIKGRLCFSGIVPWRKKWYSPGIMGPYTFVPFMECNHGIVSMDHIIEGCLTINGEEIDFTGGRGYTEKDWGHSFPSAYIWMQSNHFNYPGISFKASVARIPWKTGSFTGFISGLWLNRTLYSYTTYSRSSLQRLALSGSSIELEFQNQRTVLKISAPYENPTPLASPVKGFMRGRIEESMTSVVKLLLADRHTSQIIYQGEGRNTSVELSGNIVTLL
jgi:tocopherol cyclase